MKVCDDSNRHVYERCLVYLLETLVIMKISQVVGNCPVKSVICTYLFQLTQCVLCVLMFFLLLNADIQSTCCLMYEYNFLSSHLSKTCTF